MYSGGRSLTSVPYVGAQPPITGPGQGQKESAVHTKGAIQMFTFVFALCVLNTIVTIIAAIRIVVRDDRNSKEISRAGNDYLARWTK